MESYKRHVHSLRGAIMPLLRDCARETWQGLLEDGDVTEEQHAKALQGILMASSAWELIKLVGYEECLGDLMAGILDTIDVKGGVQ